MDLATAAMFGLFILAITMLLLLSRRSLAVAAKFVGALSLLFAAELLGAFLRDD